MNSILNEGPYTVKLQLAIIAPDGQTQILIADALELGPRVLYYDPDTKETRDTFLQIGQYNDAERLLFPLRDRLPDPGNDFFEVNLFAKMNAFEFNGQPVRMLQIDAEKYHELVEVHACSKVLAHYLCTCGAKGEARLSGKHQLRQVNVEDRARKNHASHAKRAHNKAERSRH